MDTEEATINPDGSSSYEPPPTTTTPPLNDTEGFDADEGFDLPPVEELANGVDPAIYLVIAFVVICGLYYFFFKRNKEEDADDDFFASIDCDKFELSLPAEVEDYYKTRARCEKMGWKPGEGPTVEATQNPGHPHRMLAQALMKRAMADIPNVMKIQKESSGMSKLYARSMCSVKQWRSYQMAEALISQEVADVKAEADDIEPGWSHSIWQQASQYHAMLQKKHEMELQAAQAAQEKVKQAEANKATGKSGKKKKPVDEAKAKELAAQKAAEELLREEEKKEKKNQKGFAGGLKKGFMEGGGKGGKKK